MIEEIKEIKEVTEVKETVTGRAMKCDVCGKIILDGRKKIFPKRQFWRIYTGHGGQDNVTCESKESFDACSPECLHKKLDEYITTSSCDGNINPQYFIMWNINGGDEK